ncbi:hypothetical protein CPB85DRAFT_1296212 [Mucidula mucida]|nr:hypothetical protein CPB85DRAFT_1296212 [Mucidula mucida]
MPRIKPPHIELPAPVFELERCTVLPEYSINPHDFVDNDSDDEEIEYALDLGAESPPRSAIEEKASWDIMPSGAEFSPVSSSSEKVCGCGKCTTKTTQTSCCQLPFCVEELTKRLRNSERCPSCDRLCTLEDLLSTNPITEQDSSNSASSEDDYDAFEEDVLVMKATRLTDADNAPSTILSRALGTIALMVFLYALTFRTTDTDTQ